MQKMELKEISNYQQYLKIHFNVWKRYLKMLKTWGKNMSNLQIRFLDMGIKR